MNAKKAKQLRRLARKLAPITTPRYEQLTYHFIALPLEGWNVAFAGIRSLSAVNPIELKVGTCRALYKKFKKADRVGEGLLV